MPARESLPILSPSGKPLGTSLPILPAPVRPRGARLWAPLLAAAAGALILAGLGMGLTLERMAHEALRNLAFAARAFREILPYFALSVVLSAWATSSGAAERIRVLFRRGEGAAILGASAIGAVVPLCSCGVIPVIAALLAGGVPLGPVMAFWISAPLMSPEKFTLTAALLGLPYAAMNLATAVALGAAAGGLTSLADRRGLLAGQIRPIGGADACCTPATPPARGDIRLPLEKEGMRGRFAPRTFAGDALASALFLGKWLTLAFLLEALLTHYLDPAWIQALLGGRSPWSIPLATAAGIPLYVSGVASIPIVSGLLEGGMSPGAAMAFLIAGPVTTVCAVGAVLALVRGRAFALYLGSGVAGALAAGYAFQWIMG